MISATWVKNNCRELFVQQTAWDYKSYQMLVYLREENKITYYLECRHVHHE